MKKIAGALTGTVVVLLLAVSSFAQDPGGPPEEHPPVREYVVASPRAALVRPLPIMRSLTRRFWGMIGAAHNFARPDGDVAIPHGTVLKIKLSENTEGVWYRVTSGSLGTLLILEVKNPHAESVEDTWVPLGRDGAGDFRKGPSVGTARDVSVPFIPPHPGEYLLRARIYTYALPRWIKNDETAPEAADVMVKRPYYGYVARSVVFVKVRVGEPGGPVEIEEFEVPASEMPAELLDGIIE